MARRASFFQKLRSQKKSVLLLRGPYEYFSPGKKKNPSSSLFKRLNTVFSRLDYDFSFPLSLKYSNQGRKALSFTKDDLGKAVIHTQKGGLGVVLLPTKLQEGDYSKINGAVQDFRANGDVSLVIAVSALGAKKENSLFQGHGFVPDILLGGGEGAGLRGRLKNGGKTLWVRPYPEGKSVNYIRILSPLGPVSSGKWKKNKNVQFGVYSLGGDIQSDPGIKKLLDEVRE